MTLNKDLSVKAQYRAKHMTEFSHDGWRDAFKDTGYTHYGENLARNFKKADEMMKSFINSPSHYRNLINPNFTEFGVGYNKKTKVLVVLFAGK